MTPTLRNPFLRTNPADRRWLGRDEAVGRQAGSEQAGWGGTAKRCGVLIRLARVLALFVITWSAACSIARPTDLSTLVQRDSIYLDPSTRTPHSGPVFRHFRDDPAKVQIEGTLKHGVWEGEMTVYHASGRIRYQGRLSAGAPCGAWVENQSDEVAGTVFQELQQQINSMGLYPPCPGEEGG